MNILIGKLYVNKTWRFLIPCLKGHGKSFIDKFNSVFKLAVGIHDTLLDNSNISNSNNLYVMINKTYREKNYKDFIEFIKYQNYFKGDYCPDSDIISSKKHMIVIKIPNIYNNAYTKFLQGKYSEMYSKKDLELLFSHPSKKKELDILTKNEKSLNEFIETLKKEFNTIIFQNDVYDFEYELPLKYEEEVFNFNNNKKIYLNNK